MAITETIVDDKIEVVGDYKSIQVRTASIIKKNGVELTRSFHRRVLDCVSSVKNDDDSWTHTDTDTSKESTEIQGIASVVWTNEVKELKRLSVEKDTI